ncbi:MAG: hypothetical protein FWG36_04505 [Oscillospiraceae bacterium]|nr:hypothetical protein [Oscillospiraceae bacterium]
MDVTARSVSELGVDLARFDPRTRVREAVAANQEIPVTVRRTHRVSLRLSSVLLFIFFMGGVLLLVLSHAQISALSASNSRLTKEMTEAVREQAVLTAALESRITLDEISEIAIRDLGFVKLDRRQITYIDMSGEEKAELYGKVSLKSKITNNISGIFK